MSLLKCMYMFDVKLLALLYSYMFTSGYRPEPRCMVEVICMRSRCFAPLLLPVPFVDCRGCRGTSSDTHGVG